MYSLVLKNAFEVEHLANNLKHVILLQVIRRKVVPPSMNIPQRKSHLTLGKKTPDAEAIDKEYAKTKDALETEAVSKQKEHKF